MSAPWGLNSDGQPMDARGAATERIQAVVAEYIRIHLAIASCGDHDPKTINEIQHLHLAEPWLPAVEAVNQLEEAGLLCRDFDPYRRESA